MSIRDLFSRTIEVNNEPKDEPLFIPSGMIANTSVRATNQPDMNYKPTLPQRLTNPGALEFANQPGAVRSGRFADFQGNIHAGYQALHAQINRNIAKNPNQTIKDFISAYAPPVENNTKKYYNDLANLLGVKPDTKIGSLKSRVDDVARHIATLEGFYAK